VKCQALDGRWQFAHVGDQPVGFEFGDRDVGISKLKRRWTGMPARRATPISGPASPTMIADDNWPPARAIVCRKIAGSGFDTPKVSAPQIAEKSRT